MIIAVDFDGTIVEHKYPEIGKEIPFATTTLKMLMKEQHRLILWTVRKGKTLDEAVAWCKERGVEFYAINKNYPEEKVEEGKAATAPENPTREGYDFTGWDKDFSKVEANLEVIAQYKEKEIDFEVPREYEQAEPIYTLKKSYKGHLTSRGAIALKTRKGD